MSSPNPAPRFNRWRIALERRLLGPIADAGVLELDWDARLALPPGALGGGSGLIFERRLPVARRESGRRIRHLRVYEGGRTTMTATEPDGTPHVTVRRS